MVKEVDVAYKTKTCTKCDGDCRTPIRPVIYIDLMGNEYPFPEYTSMGTMRGDPASKKLPTNVKLYQKLEECSRCNGIGKENYVDEFEEEPVKRDASTRYHNDQP